MALSGSLKSSGWWSSSRGEYIYIRLDWSVSQSISGNYSDMTWKLVCERVSSGNVEAGGFTVTIDGDTVYSSSEDDRITITNGTQIAHGTKRLKHNNDGSRSFSAYISGAIYAWNKNVSGTESFTLNNIPRKAVITSAPNFKSTQDLVIKYDNKAGNSVNSLKIGLYTNGETILNVSVDKTKSSKRFSFGNEQLNIIYRYAASSYNVSIHVILETVIGGNTYKDEKFLTCSIDDCSPTIDPRVWDSNENTSSLDPPKIILNASTANATIGASAHKGAHISSYKIVNSGVSKSSEPAIFDKPYSNEFYFEATDSRGEKVSTTLKPSSINYVPLTCYSLASTEFISDDQVSINLTIQGSCYTGFFGDVENKVVCQFRYRKSSGEDWSQWSTIGTTAGNDSTYSASVKIENLDYDSVYLVQGHVTDELGTIGEKYSDSTQVEMKPVFDWSKNDFSINVPSKVYSINGVFIKKYHVSSINYLDIRTNLEYNRSDTGYTRQTIFIFGIDNGTPVHGLITLYNNGSTAYDGTGNITSTTTDLSNKVRINFYTVPYDDFVLISGQWFE